MADDGAGEPAGILEMWACHVRAVEVFQLCPVAGIGHMGGTCWEGIGPAAIAAACWLLRIPRTEQAEIARDVAFMGACVARERNRKASAREGR
jgi:hypothetical protein